MNENMTKTTEHDVERKATRNQTVENKTINNVSYFITKSLITDFIMLYSN